MANKRTALSVTEPEYPTRARGTVLDRAYHASRAACETELSLSGEKSESGLSDGVVRPVIVDGDGPGLVCEATEIGRRVGLVGPSVAAALRAAAENRMWTGSGWLLDPRSSSTGRVQQTVAVEHIAGECGLRVGSERGKSVVVALPAEVAALLQRELRALGVNELAGAAQRRSEQTSSRTREGDQP